jgi:general stress protein YciG
MPEKGELTVREAGRNGGDTTKRRYGPQFYHRIGRKGEQRLRQLIAQGKRSTR